MRNAMRCAPASLAPDPHDNSVVALDGISGGAVADAEAQAVAGSAMLSLGGLAKNRARMFSLFALANLVIVKRRLLALGGTGVF